MGELDAVDFILRKDEKQVIKKHEVHLEIIMNLETVKPVRRIKMRRIQKINMHTYTHLQSNIL